MKTNMINDNLALTPGVYVLTYQVCTEKNIWYSSATAYADSNKGYEFACAQRDVMELMPKVYKDIRLIWTMVQGK